MGAADPVPEEQGGVMLIAQDAIAAAWAAPAQRLLPSVA